MEATNLELFKGTREELQTNVRDHQGPLAVVYTATWSAPSRKLISMLGHIANEAQHVHFLRVDTNELYPEHLEGDITTLPYVIFYNGVDEEGNPKISSEVCGLDVSTIKTAAAQCVAEPTEEEEKE